MPTQPQKTVSLLDSQRPRAHVTLANLIKGLAGADRQRLNWQIMGPGDRTNRGTDWIAYEATRNEFVEHHFDSEALARAYVETKMFALMLEAAGLKCSRFDGPRFIKIMNEIQEGANVTAG